MSDRGAASVLMLGLVLVVLLFGAGLGAAGQYVAARFRAQNAADAAALAAAPVTFHPYGGSGDPVAEAAEYAARNGAYLVACRCPIDRSFRPRAVTVRVGVTARLLVVGRLTVEARSRAEFSPPRLWE